MQQNNKAEIYIKKIASLFLHHNNSIELSRELQSILKEYERLYLSEAIKNGIQKAKQARRS